VDGDGMEALRLLRHAGFGAIEANGGGGVRGRLGLAILLVNTTPR